MPGSRGGVAIRAQSRRYTSTDAIAWTFAGIVATHGDSPGQEGACEHDVDFLADGRLICVYRTDGGDGYPDHRRAPFMKTTSSDDGKTWTKPVAMPDDVLSARPQLLMATPTGPLLLTGGRPYLNLWASTDGLGERWDTYNIAARHNLGSDDYKFCDAFANSTSAWQGSTCYNSLQRVDGGDVLVCYDNVGTAPPAAPLECQADPVTTFCMRVSVD